MSEGSCLKGIVSLVMGLKLLCVTSLTAWLQSNFCDPEVLLETCLSRIMTLRIPGFP